jgi:glucosamine--fructose-6-phosphate aminotransferase (isomerizing)
MCGIVGYLGFSDSKKIILNGLKELEYRGYDSAGITILQDGKFHIFKSVGKLNNLIEKSRSLEINGFSVGIGHTRWATHGKPTEDNAHPHSGEFTHIVHNGIIENYGDLKTDLLYKGYKFSSQTDTEVIVHLFEEILDKHQFSDSDNGSFLAFRDTIGLLHGAYALLLIKRNEPERIYFAKEGSPLIIGTNFETGEQIFASSDSPLIGLVDSVIYLKDGEYGYVERGLIKILNMSGVVIQPEYKTLPQNKELAQKSGFRYFMEKEIYEQSQVVSDTMLGRIGDKNITFDEISPDIFNGINEIKLCACGTSYHTALASSYLFERIARVRVSVEFGSEFRYKNPILHNDTLFVVISQSGETADTLASLKLVVSAGLKTLAICNVDNSSIVRTADYTILTRAGIEKGVASTKAFATQMVVLYMFSIYLAQIRNIISYSGVEEHLQILREIPNAMTINDRVHEKIKRLSKRYLHGHGFFFIGRDIFYPLALEGALKLKEISYLHSEGYPAGEMKHGPIALADPELFTIALLPKNMLYDKTKSNIEELGARDSTICVISSESVELADDFIEISAHHHYMLEFFEMTTVLQLLAMEIAIRLKNDVDMPRNLAKSVTVE